jgi:hypothetical protein
VESGALPLLSEPIETRAVWYTAFLSVTLALVALLPSLPLRALAVTVGVTLAVALAPAYLRHATPFSAAILTSGAFFYSVGTAAWLASLPWERGFSGTGDVGRPTAWLFDTTVLCVGMGVLATGRLMAREGSRRGDLSRRGYLLASTLPVISFAGCLVIAFCPGGGAPVLAKAHFIGTWTVLGSFWCGMVASTWLRGLSRPLRYYSLVAAVLAFGTSVPTGLYQLHLIGPPSLPMRVEELVHFSVYFVWFCWLAREWSPTPTR